MLGAFPEYIRHKGERAEQYIVNRDRQDRTLPQCPCQQKQVPALEGGAEQREDIPFKRFRIDPKPTPGACYQTTPRRATTAPIQPVRVSFCSRSRTAQRR
jgi:hypothetical protein